MPMTAFPQLSDGDIDAIIAYTTAGDAKPADAAEATTVLATPRSSGKWITYLVSFVLLAFVVWVFVSSNNGFLKIVSTIFVLLVIAYLLFGSLFTVGVDQGYKPIQPIAFSHKIHSGDNKIDCQYCHSSAKHS
jgi:thiol:disulfide interchange protein